jgi:hypothetical protein
MTFEYVRFIVFALVNTSVEPILKAGQNEDIRRSKGRNLPPQLAVCASIYRISFLT